MKLINELLVLIAVTSALALSSAYCAGKRAESKWRCRFSPLITAHNDRRRMP